MLAILAPGQGAQTPGFLTPWVEGVPGFADRLHWWSTVVGVDLISAGTTWDAVTIRDTAVAQPLLVAAALATADALLTSDSAQRAVGVYAGHSVGEFTTAALSGALSPEASMALVGARGRSMAAAAALAPTGMSAILGGDPAEVLAAIEALDLTAANHNGAGQVVAAGRTENLDKLRAEPPAGTRVVPLSVAGAFHTEFMSPAVDELVSYTVGVPVRDPHTLVLSNSDGAVVSSGPELLRRLFGQVAAPVRWDLCMKTLGQLGVNAVIELTPGGTLTGLIRRALPGVELLALKTPDDLPAAHALIAAHKRVTPEAAPAWRVVVAPVAGQFVPVDVELGSVILPGGTIGVVESRGRQETVVAAHGGVLIEWLAEASDPVNPGQPLARLHPAEAHQ
ncbi:ACP S-malonyltransferase [Acidothermaceae bacterium B102]|nr:ACP S-malonyltransferase [Acidothermaceae bacterium B102]